VPNGKPGDHPYTGIVVRSGCGFFIGACVAVATMTRCLREDYYPLLWIGASGTLCAYLAAKHGDRFWERIGETKAVLSAPQRDITSSTAQFGCRPHLVVSYFSHFQMSGFRTVVPQNVVRREM
jgi:hypothetical protein